MKKELIRLGVKLSLSVVESMFLLCDDIRTMLSFCCKLWIHQDYRSPDPVYERLFWLMHYVYLRDIEPKKRVFKNDGQSGQWRLISTAWEDFADGILVMHGLVRSIRRKDWSFDDRLLLSFIENYKQVLKRLEDKLRSGKDVSQAHGFRRETIESNIYDLWKSLFDEEAKEATQTLKVIRSRISWGLFGPISGKPFHREIRALPLKRPYIFGKDFEKQKLKEEVVQLGVELSLLVAQSMFVLLDDDIRSMLYFCVRLRSDAIRDRDPDSPVAERLLCVVYDIKAKNFQNDDPRWDQWKFIKTTMKYFAAGIRDLDLLVSILRKEGSCFHGRVLTSRIEEALKKVDDKLRCVKDVSEANGFAKEAREAMKSNILDLWKSLFDKETEEAWKPKVMSRIEILTDLFKPLLDI